MFCTCKSTSLKSGTDIRPSLEQNIVLSPKIVAAWHDWDLTDCDIASCSTEK